MNAHTSKDLIEEYGTTDLEELAERYADLERLIVGTSWPRAGLNALASAGARLRDDIIAKPSSSLSDIRGKLKYLIVRLTTDNCDLQDAIDDLVLITAELTEIK